MKFMLFLLPAFTILLVNCRSTGSSSTKDTVVAGAHVRPGLYLTCTEGTAALTLRRVAAHDVRPPNNYELLFHSVYDEENKGRELKAYFVGEEQRDKKNEKVEKVILKQVISLKDPSKLKVLGQFSKEMQSNKKMLDLSFSDENGRPVNVQVYPRAGFETNPEPFIDAHVSRGKARFDFFECLIYDSKVTEQDPVKK